MRTISIERAQPGRRTGALGFWGTSLLAAVTILASTGCDKLKARDHMNQGVASFRNAKYSDAVEHFKQAAALEPDNPNARAYLATAYMVQWIPGAESPENVEFSTKAKEEFLKVLEKDPNNTTALASLASLAYNAAQSLPLDKKLEKYDEAASWNKKRIAADDKDKEAYYMLGVISWAKWYPALNLARVNLHMKPEDPGPLKDKKVKEDLRTQYGTIIDDGIANLQKAIDIDKEYDDAMAYMNLLIREKADLAESPEEYKKDIETADGWVQKALDTKKIKAARQPTTGGIVQDTKQ
jgi:tetratricopeptide (TPR) repeat protein